MNPVPLHPSSRTSWTARLGAGLLLSLFAVSLFAPAAQAEGSRELTAQGGNRAYLEWQPA